MANCVLDIDELRPVFQMVQQNTGCVVGGMVLNYINCDNLNINVSANIRGNLTLSGNITSNSRSYQELNTTSGFESVNGYYGLAKDAFPIVSLDSAITALNGNWTSVVPSQAIRFSALVWAPASLNGNFVAIGESVGTPGLNDTVNVYRSTDGFTWVTTPVSWRPWTGIAHSKKLNRFVACSTSSNATNGPEKIMTSDNNGADVVLANCIRTAANTYTCTSTAGLVVGAAVLSSSLGVTIPVGTRIATIPSTTQFTTNLDISGLTVSQSLTVSSWVLRDIGFALSGCSRLSANTYTCASTAGLVVNADVTHSVGATVTIPLSTRIASIVNNTTFTTNNDISISGGTTTLYVGNGWDDVIYVDELDLFVLISSTNINDRSIMTSPDGITWTPRATGSAWGSICWSPQLSLLVAVAGGKIGYSKNGISWTVINVPLIVSGQDVCWSPQLGLFCNISAPSNGFIRFSQDGINWQNRPFPDHGLTAQKVAVRWIDELGVFVVLMANSANFYISRNAVDWITVSGVNATYKSNGLAWSPELSVLLIGGFGLGPAPFDITENTYSLRVSNLQGRLPTSYNVFDSPFNRIDQAGNWAIQTVHPQGTYTLGNSTPSVTGVELLIINNTGSTAITNFTGGEVGQILQLVFLDNGLTTIASGTNIKLASAFTVTPNDTLLLLCVSASPSLWVELERSTNDT